MNDGCSPTVSRFMSTDPPLVLVHVDAVPSSGRWNMALDEALLIDAVDEGRCHLRFYGWEEPTLSLGYFQRSEERLADPALAGLPAVRRLSGGGAILHDRELTYSCVVPPAHRFARQPLELYDTVHAAFVDVLAALGIEVAPRGAAHAQDAQPFLCFVRGDERDLICRGHKVLGSAQRRRRGAVLQHGSLLLERSDRAASIPGLYDLQPLRLPDEFATTLGPRIARSLGRIEIAPLPVTATTNAERLAAEAYSHLDWRVPFAAH
jgi:lipoyl(octanoyl) transferase